MCGSLWWAIVAVMWAKSGVVNRMEIVEIFAQVKYLLELIGAMKVLSRTEVRCPHSWKLRLQMVHCQQ